MARVSAAQRQFYERSLHSWADLRARGERFSQLHLATLREYGARLAADDALILAEGPPYDPNQQPDEERL